MVSLLLQLLLGPVWRKLWLLVSSRVLVIAHHVSEQLPNGCSNTCYFLHFWLAVMLFSHALLHVHAIAKEMAEELICWVHDFSYYCADKMWMCRIILPYPLSLTACQSLLLSLLYPNFRIYLFYVSS